MVTLGTARPDRDDGEVGYRQTLWLERTMKKYENKVTILAMHHHLIGIPDTGSDRLTIVDAGDVLRATLDSKVNLVCVAINIDLGCGILAICLSQTLVLPLLNV